MIKTTVWLLLCLTVALPSLFGQEIELKNPSFEDLPRPGATPMGWYDCGNIEETPPDIQPGQFNVTTKAKDKNSYLGLVTRDNDTWEGVAQRLSVPMEAGQCYNFSVFLARSDRYISISKTSRVEENFNRPIRLRIWGGTSYCSKKEKLAETVAVKHTNWKEYNLKFTPKAKYSYIFLEAFFEPSLVPYNGNLLIDDCSNLTPCDKKIEEPIAAAEEPKPKPKPQKPATTPQPKPKDEPIAVTPKQKVITPELDRTKIAEGKIIQVNNLYFKADSFRIETNSYAALNEVYDFLVENPSLKIEVGGHTNDVPKAEYCDQLSTARAKAVVEYLVDKGIDGKRLSYKGYGKRKPVAPNSTKEGRMKNQRVEIKILSFGG
jgi:outer membrane protein OmpA-like peptidoglycan-associated protein